jgi:hypothetical protein
MFSVLASILVLSASGPGLLAQAEPPHASILFSIYQQYLVAAETHDLDRLEALSSDQDSQKQLEKLKELDEKQQKAMFELIARTQPESQES